jgi:hypothetical protein
MNSRLSVVIAELQLVQALLIDSADTSKGSQVATLLTQAQTDLVNAIQQIIGQNPVGGGDR